MSPGASALRWARSHGDVLVVWEPVNRGPLAVLLAAAEHPPLRTRSFVVAPATGVTVVVHRLGHEQLDNDIGRLIADELVGPGAVSGERAFERCFAGVVESTGPSTAASWRRFYVNTLRGLRAGGTRIPNGPIAAFSEIYAHAAELAGPSVLDVGSCFGFFGLLLAADGQRQVVSSDRDPAIAALARRMAGELGAKVEYRIADVLRPLPFAPRSFDTVTALHVLEHLPTWHTAGVLERLCRMARRRVIVAVPLEDTPDPVYGHRRAFDLAGLLALADREGGWRAEVNEHRGGWLVVDRLRARRPGSVPLPEPVGAGSND